MHQFARLAQRMFNTPIAIHPRKAEIALGALAERLGITSMVQANGSPIRPAAWFDDDDDFTSPRSTRHDPGYDVFEGAALISVEGTLVHKTGSLRPYSGLCGYDGLRQAYLTAQADPDVRGIAMMYDTGGGEVSGCADLADTMRELRGNKPTWAILSESAYSAGYWLASTADRVIVPRTGGTGSIGVICMHVDMSAALENAGFKVTFITSEGADYKTDGHPEIPLSPDALGRFKAEIDEMGEIFYDAVARSRGLTTDKVRALRAGTFMGAAGVTAGLADAVMAPEQAFAELIAAIA